MSKVTLMRTLVLKALGFIILFMQFALSSAYAKEVQYFDIWEYRVEGNTLLENEEVESALYHYLGTNKSLDTVEEARDYLQSIYKRKGYPIVVVAIPQQNVIGGVVTLNVIEGKIDRLKISGNKYFSRRELRKEVPSLVKGAPLNMQQVRSEIDAANQMNTYRSVVPVIRPGRRRGTMEMELKVKDRLPVHASIEANNRYTSNTSHSRLMATLGYDHLWQKHHSFILNYQMSPEETGEIEVYNFTYTMPTGKQSRLAMYAVESDSEVATVTGGGDDLTVLGNGSIYGVRSINMLNSLSYYYHSILFGIDYKDFGESQEVSSEDDSSSLNVPIDYLAWTIAYNGTLRQELLTQFSVSANFGIRGLENDQEEFDFKRFNADPNYFFIRADITQNWPVNDRFNVLYNLGGQYTESPLISNEQFSMGGVDTVRGYLESSALGDTAVLVSLQANYDLLKGKIKKPFQSLGFSAFVDAGRVRTIDALADADGEIDSREDLVGAGIGLNARAFKTMSLSLYAAQPLRDLDTEDFDDGVRFHFSLSYEM